MNGVIPNNFRAWTSLEKLLDVFPISTSCLKTKRSSLFYCRTPLAPYPSTTCQILKSPSLQLLLHSFMARANALHEDAINDKNKLADEYMTQIADLKRNSSSLDERYSNLSKTLEAAKHESLEWKRKYKVALSKQKAGEEQASSEVANLAAEARLAAACEQTLFAQEEAGEWKRKYDVAVKEAKSVVEKEAVVQDRASKQTRNREYALRANFKGTLADKEAEIKDKARKIEQAEQRVTTLNMELKLCSITEVVAWSATWLGRVLSCVCAQSIEDDSHPSFDLTPAQEALWKVAFLKEELHGLITEQQKEIDWQGKDPSTARGGGFISLENLYFARNFRISVQLCSVNWSMETIAIASLPSIGNPQRASYIADLTSGIGMEWKSMIQEPWLCI
ncbi:hypothetical protein Tco_0479323 [Tanacetum coccineum]